MKSPLLVFITVIISLLVQEGKAISKTDLDKSYKIQFPRGIESEARLEECQDHYSPCSLIQNPFFYPFITRRFCRCKHKACPDIFETRRTYDTVFINNREQLKFCYDLPKCHGGWGILRVGAENNIPYHLNCHCPAKRRYWRLMNPEESSESQEETSIKLGDHLPENEQTLQVFRWKRSTNVQEISTNALNLSQTTVMHAIPIKLYKCEKMDKCVTSACGTIRTDMFATYQNCTCAPNSFCLPTPSLATPISEVMNIYGFGKATRCFQQNRGKTN